MMNLSAEGEFLYSLIKSNAGKIETLEKNTVKNSRSIKDIEEESTLFPAESDDIANAVKKKGVAVMGGKHSGAYQNVDIRRAVYRDIYGVMKREYGLINEKGGQMSYKKLKRKHIKGALMVIESYELPTALEEQVIAENELDD